MTPVNRLAVVAVVAAALSGCSQSASTDNQAAKTETTDEVAQNDMMAGNTAMNSADPYSEPMMKMNQAMMAAEGANPSETWARKMIPHHQGAVDMSKVLISQGGDEKFLAKARKTSGDMKKEISTLEEQLKAGVTSGGSTGPANPFGPAMEKMHADIMAATGATPGEIWTRKMIAHHQGAIDMSSILVKQGGEPKVLASARMTIDMQTKEIADLQKMLMP